MHKNLTTTAAGITFALALAGCSGPDTTADPATSPTGTATTSPTGTATTSPAPTPATIEPIMAAIGETATYAAGVDVTLAFQGWHSTTTTNSGAVDGRIAVFNISVTNNSPTEIQASLLSFPDVQVGPENTTALIAADEDAGLVPGVMRPLQPGESDQSLAIFGIPADAAGSVRFEFDRIKRGDPPIVFTGALPPT